MEENKPGVFVRAQSPYVEIEDSRCDTYQAFVNKAPIKCKLGYKKRKVCSLFKLNGAQVLSEDININGKVKPWTLGRYLLLMKKSPSNVKLGIGHISVEVSDSESNSDSTEKSKQVLSQCTFGRHSCYPSCVFHTAGN